MNEEEDELKLQGVNEKMRRQKGVKAEIPSSGFSLKFLVKVDEGRQQSCETDCITAPLINSVSRHHSLCVHLHVLVCTYALTLDVLNLSVAHIQQSCALVAVYVWVQCGLMNISQDVTCCNSCGRAVSEDER